MLAVKRVEIRAGYPGPIPVIPESGHLREFYIPRILPMYLRLNYQEQSSNVKSLRNPIPIHVIVSGLGDGVSLGRFWTNSQRNA